jgi:DNA polymerase-3 subunit beta
MAITIDANLLKAAAHLAAVKDVRYYLNGVLVEATASTTRAVATDGSILGAFEFEHHNALAQDCHSLIVPTDVIALLPKAGATQFVREQSRGAHAWLARHINGTTPFTAIDGVFPDYRRVLVPEVSGEAGYYDLRLLSRFDKVAQVLSGKRQAIGSPVHVWQNGPKKAAAVTIGDHRFVGVIMPRACSPMPSLRWAA